MAKGNPANRLWRVPSKWRVLLIQAGCIASAWYDRIAMRGDHDLALVDEVFGVFLGVTFEATNFWGVPAESGLLSAFRPRVVNSAF